MEFKGTKGPWTYSPQKGIIGHCHMAQVWDSNGRNLAEIQPTNDETEASANAQLIRKAPEILNELKETVIDLNILKNQVARENEYGLSRRWDGMAELIDKWIERKNKLIKEATEI